MSGRINELVDIIAEYVGEDRTLFRAYDADEFLETSSWRRLRTIIATGNGGVYGLYGPRGSGKSWLMHRAITEATAAGGTGLWFPCPSGYEPAAFLSMLADTLASQVEGLRARTADARARPGNRHGNGGRIAVRSAAWPGRPPSCGSGRGSPPR